VVRHCGISKHMYVYHEVDIPYPVLDATVYLAFHLYVSDSDMSCGNTLSSLIQCVNFFKMISSSNVRVACHFLLM